MRGTVRGVAHALALSLLFVTTLTVATPAQANTEGDVVDIPVANGGFEEAAQDGQAPSWANLLGPHATIDVSDELAHEGEQSLRIHADAGGGYSRASSQLIPIEPGGTYEISAQVYTSGENPLANIYARTVDDVGNLISSTFSAAPQVTDEWNRVVHRFTAADNAAGMYIWLYIGSNAVGTHHFDQVTLTQSVPLTEATILNPGFEKVDSDERPVSWRLSFAGVEGTITIDDEIVLSGERSLHLDDISASESLGMESTQFPIEPGETYRAIVNVYRVTGTPAVYIRFYNAEGQVVDSTSSNINTPSGQWGIAVGDGIAPAEAVTATVLLYSGSTAVSEAYFDDIAITTSPITTSLVGPQHQTVNAFTSAIGARADGTVVGYVATYGTPANLSEVDLATGDVLRMTPLPGASGVWGLTVAPSGDVYAGGITNGTLYRWDPTAEHAEVLGKVVSTESHIISLSAADDGTIYGGTFPNAHLFAYDPTNGGSFSTALTDYGTAIDDATYARSVKWHDGKVYVGTGTPARLVELDPVNGSSREIALPKRLDAAEMIYGLESAGDQLTVRTEYPGQLALLDPASEEWAIIGESSGLIASPLSDDGLIYFRTADATLATFDPESGESVETSFTGIPNNRPMGWVELDSADAPGQSLVWFDVQGNLYQYNPQTDRHNVISPRVPQTPAVIHSIGVGSDGNVYTSAYVSGGLAWYDPGSAATHPSGVPIGQVDSFLVDGDALWTGSYTRANLHEFDTSAGASVEPRHHFDLHDQRQDRVMALEKVGKSVVIGTVAEYGVNGGALTVFDPTEPDVDPVVYRDVVPDHAVVSLAADTLSDQGIVYAGTTVDGGLGTTPTSTQGKVIAFDTVAGTTLWEVDGVPGERAVTSLVLSSTGSLWGIGTGTLFEMDPSDGTILRSKKLVDPAQTDFVWAGTALDIGPDGYLYAFANRQAMRIDPVTLSVMPLVQNATAYSADFASGSLWFARSADLYRADIASILSESAYSADSSLAELFVDGEALAEFAPEKTEYSITVALGDADPSVRVIAGEPEARVQIDRSEGVPGTTTVTVTAADGMSQTTYTVSFVVDPTSTITNLVPPSIDGTAQVGESLRATVGQWDFAEAEFSMQWYRDGSPIPGATADSYLLGADDAGTEVSVSVTAIVPETDISATAASESLMIVAEDSSEDGSEPGGPGNGGEPGGPGGGGASDDGSGDDGSDGASDDSLAATGADSRTFVGLLALLLVAGAVSVMIRRRARESAREG